MARPEHGSGWANTTYAYNAADDLTTVTDPAGNVITNVYDQAGRRTAMNDLQQAIDDGYINLFSQIPG